MSGLRHPGSSLLGTLWLLLGVVKVVSPPQTDAMEAIVAPALAPTLALSLAILEVALGTSQFFGRLRALGLCVSFVLLSIYGTLAIAHPLTRCTCAGRLVALPPVWHSILTAAMLALVARGMKEVAWTPGKWQVRTTFVGTALAVVLTLLSLPRAPSATFVEPLSVRAEYEQPMPVGPSPMLRGAVDKPSHVTPPGSAQRILGVVLDEGDRPVRGARVWPSGADAYIGTDSEAVEVAVSGTEGEFVVEHAVPDSWLCVDAAGYLPWCAPVHGFKERDRVTVIMQSGLSLSGRVLDETGAPVDGALVRAWGRYGEDCQTAVVFGPNHVPERSHALTSADGSYRMGGLSARAYRLHATARDHLSESYVESAVVRTPDGRTPVDFVLRRLYVLRAVAVDSDTREVIPTATYATVLRSGAGWLPASGAVRRSNVETGLLLTAKGMSEWLCRSPESTRVGIPPVEIRVLAFGYEATRSRCLPELASSAQTVYTIPMRPAPARLGSASFSAGWTSERPFTGSLVLRIRGSHDPIYEAVCSFSDGASSSEIPMPAGRYAASFGPLTGSAASWRQPQGSAWVPFEIQEGVRTRVRLTLQGGALVVRPHTSDGHRIREFLYGVNGEQFCTWTSPIELQRLQDGVVLYLDAGAVDLYVAKEGFAPASSRLGVQAGGAVTEWEPVLVRGE